MMTNEQRSSGQTSRPFKRPAFVASAVFLALVIVLMLALALTNDSQGGDPAPTTSSRPPQPQQSAATAAGCQPTDTDQQIPTAPPAAVSWQLFETLALPVSQAAGPLTVQGGVAACYARTPTGALIAATQISARYLFASDWRKVTLLQVAPGPGRETYLRRRSGSDGQGEEQGASSGQPGDLGQIAAFRFVTYTRSVAVVQIVMRYATGQQAMTVLTVQWNRGDWRLELQPDGAPNPPPQQIESLDGYIRWGGV